MTAPTNTLTKPIDEAEILTAVEALRELEQDEPRDQGAAGVCEAREFVG